MVQRRDLILGLAAAGSGLATAGDAGAAGAPNASPGLVEDIRGDGAKCDGVTDDTAAVLKSAGRGEVVFPKGITLIARSTSISAPARVLPGARIHLPTGVTLTLQRGLEAGLDLVFQGDGEVQLAPGCSTVAFPEWWGAQVGSRASAVVNTAAINAAIVSGAKIIDFRAADYWLASPVLLSTPYVTLRGVGRWYVQGPQQPTRLIKAYNNGPVIQIGPATPPTGGVNAFQKNNKVSGFSLQPGENLVPPSRGSELAGSIGILAQYAIDFDIEDVRADEMTVGLCLNACVGFRVDRFYGFRSAGPTGVTPAKVQGSISGATLTVTTTTDRLGFGDQLSGGGAAVGTIIIDQISGVKGGAGKYSLNVSRDAAGPFLATYDPFWGIWVNGAARFGAAGGNASTYIYRSGAGIGGAPTFYSEGIHMDALFEDTFIRDFETVSLAIGINASGLEGLAVGSLDLHIDHLIIDQFTLWGATIHDLSVGSGHLINSYFAPAEGASAKACINISNCRGLFTLQSNEGDGVGNTLKGGGACAGLNLTNSSGVMARGNRWTDCVSPVLGSGLRNCVFADGVSNFFNAPKGAAFQLSGPNLGVVFDGIIQGAPETFLQGVCLVGSETTLSEFRMTGVDRDAIKGGGAAQLNYHGENIRTAGHFGGNNLATGVFGD